MSRQVATVLSLTLSTIFFGVPAHAGFWDRVRDAGIKIDPTNPNSRVRETLRNVDPGTGDIYVSNNSSTWIRVQVMRSEANVLNGFVHHFLLRPGEQNVLVEDNVRTGEYGLSAVEVDANNNALKRGKIWYSKWVDVRSGGFHYSFNE